MVSPSSPRLVTLVNRNLIDDSPLQVGSPSPILQPPTEQQQQHATAADGHQHARVSFSRPPLRKASHPGIPFTRTFTGGSPRVAPRDQDAFPSPVSERPPIPSALPSSGIEAAYSTPLPVIPMIVLSITMLGEFLSANVCTPFLLFMVEGFLSDDTEADVGYWTGILVSTFFLTQFLTSLLWATVAERHGQRIVLFVSLLGSALTCLAFGTSTSLAEAISIRLMQGIFAGSIGVARSSVTSITDGSNEGRAYAILGFSWGLGGVAGAIIGGAFESPAQKWPNVFAKFPLFVRYPYLLPCGLAASITLTGAVLSLFLARDGGSREGAIRLPTVKEEAEEAIDEPIGGGELITDDGSPASSKNPVTQLRKKISKRFSGIFARRVLEAQGESSSPINPVPLSPSIPIPRKTSRTVSRPSKANGSAYGYGSYGSRLASSTAMSMRRGSMASTVRRRRGTFGEGGTTDGAGTPYETSNFAQRLLMANEMAVTNIADLWVAAAMNVDNEDVFMSDEDDAEDVVDDDREGEETPRSGRAMYRTFTASSTASRNPLDVRRTATGESTNPLEIHRTQTVDSATPHNSLEMHRTMTADSAASRSGTRFPSGAHSPVRGRQMSGQYSTPTRGRLSAFATTLRDSPRADVEALVPPLRPRVSRTFSATSSQLPSIYANPGVRPPPGLLVDPPLRLQAASAGEGDPFSSDGLNTIPEGERQQQQQQLQSPMEKPAPIFRQLPLMIVLQYGLLALHGTTHDQVFLSYLVSKYDAGGLNLNAAHFAQIIAIMCLAQIVYQFYFYPNIGPPRGRFSHLAMFRIGSLLFIPAYVTVTMYRVFANDRDDGNFILMTLLCISTAVRYCGSTFSYTAVSILLNYLSPPHVVGLANGLAQSIVSLARFAGPVLGGYLWSVSVRDGPNGYPLGFFICSGACAFAILISFLIR